jgi:hypothetical protein
MKIIIALSIVLLIPATTGLPQGILDQSFVPVTPNVFFYNYPIDSIGQTFTVGLTGSLTRVEVFIASNEVQAEGDISWTLTRIATAAVLASGTIPYRDLDGLYSFQPCLIPEGAVIVGSGDVLGITLSSSHRFTWAGNNMNPYSGGSVGFDPESDVGFRSFVTLIPEPRSISLVCLAMLVGLGSRRHADPDHT